MKQLSRTLRDIPPSAATAVDYQVKERRGRGLDVVSFCVGEPDFPTLPEPAAAGIRAIAGGQTRYTAPAGTTRLRAAIAASLSRAGGADYAPEEVAATTGGKYAVFAAVAALCNAGDELLIPTPCWPSYGPIARLCGGEPVFVPGGAESGFKLTPAALERACTARSKALILNDPCNPTGAVYTREEKSALLALCRERDLYVVADEVYGALVYAPASFTPAASLSADARARTLTVGSVSKSYAMTGWRLGWVAASKNIIDRITVYVNHTTGNPCTISQEAAVAALEGDDGGTAAMREAYRARRDALLPALAALGLAFPKPEGAFYAMADVRGLGWESAHAFALALLERENVAVVPCEDYGAPGYVRLAYTLPEERLLEGLARLERFVKEGKA